MAPATLLATVRQKYEALAPLLHEKAQRRWAACEARALGRGGISLVAAATGLSRPTIHRGLAELHSGLDDSEDADPQRPRIRRTGGSRHRLTTRDPSLLKDLHDLVDPATRGDPMSPLLWPCQGTRHLAEALGARGHHVSHQTVARLLTESGYPRFLTRGMESGCLPCHRLI